MCRLLSFLAGDIAYQGLILSYSGFQIKTWAFSYEILFIINALNALLLV